MKETKAKTNKLYYIKLKSFCTAEESTDKTKRLNTEWERIFANNKSNKGLIFKIYKELIQFNIKKKKTQLKKGQRTQTDIFPKKTYR